MNTGVDFGPTADDYATHRAGFPLDLFERVRAFGVGISGQRLLDLGAGTGTLAREFARRGLDVTCLDISNEMLEKAQEMARKAGLVLHSCNAPAEATGLPSNSFDVVVAGQCWHWFNREKAATEARRLLVPGGLLMLAHFDWIPYPGNVVHATEALIEAHNPAQPKPHVRLAQSTGIYNMWTFDVVQAGFGSVETFSYDIDVPYTHEGWRGRIRASQGVGASLSPEKVAAFDAELEALLKERFPEDPLQTTHRVFALVCKAPASGRK